MSLVEQLRCQWFRKKSLREILGCFRRAIPSPAHVFVDGLPISGTKRFKRALALPSIDAARRLDHRTPRGGKAISAGLVVLCGPFSTSFSVDSRSWWGAYARRTKLTCDDSFRADS